MRICKYTEVVGRPEQSIVKNAYATFDVSNPLFLGFSCYQNVNKEIIFQWQEAMHRNIFRIPFYVYMERDFCIIREKIWNIMLSWVIINPITFL